VSSARLGGGDTVIKRIIGEVAWLTWNSTATCADTAANTENVLCVL
jgi:hypothetical protein